MKRSLLLSLLVLLGLTVFSSFALAGSDALPQNQVDSGQSIEEKYEPSLNTVPEPSTMLFILAGGIWFVASKARKVH